MNDIQKIFVMNLRTIIHCKKIRISYIEDNIQVSRGYFSDSREKNRHISLEKALQISKLLDVSINDLCDENFGKKLELEAINRDIKELEKKRLLFASDIKKLEEKKRALFTDTAIITEII